MPFKPCSILQVGANCYRFGGLLLQDGCGVLYGHYSNMERKFLVRSLMLVLLLAATPASAREAIPPVHALTADPVPVVPVKIKKSTLNVEVSLMLTGALVLNQSAGERAKLKAFPIIGKQNVKGNIFPGGSALVRGNRYSVAVADLPKDGLYALWIDKTISEKTDGLIGAISVNAERVVIDRPQAPKGGQTFELMLKDKDNPSGEVMLGDMRVAIALDLRSPQTMMSAKTAKALQDAGLVRRAGTVGLWGPLPGVALPFERLTPTPGAAVAGLPLLLPAARISEARAKELDALAKAGTSTPEDELDAITVTADKKKDKRPAWLLFGADLLDRCSRIELDKPARRWRLTCNLDGPQTAQR